MSTFPSYINKEIPEWNSTDLSNWLLDNKFKKISELCKKNNINGYDLFFINEDILKNEFGINSFHERISTLKTLKKLIYAHLKLNIKNSQNGEETTLILDNNLNISLENISKSIGNIFNINPDDIIFKDYSKHQIISPTIKIVELMILFPKIYKCLNICNLKQEKSNQKENFLKKKTKNKNVNININNAKIKSSNNNYIDNEFDFKENYNKLKNDFQNINNNYNIEIINKNIKKDNNKNINNVNNDNINQINSKINMNSGSNSSSYKPSIELYINENENNIDINNKNIKSNENNRYLFNRDNQNNENKRNNIKVNRNYQSNKSPIHFNSPQSIKDINKHNNYNKQKSSEKNIINENSLYNNELYNKKIFLNINDGLSVENSDFIDKNASSNEGENKSKIYINNIINNNGGESDYSIKNNSFPSLSYSDKLNNNHNENYNKMDLRHHNNENVNENDTRPLNMKQSYKGPQKNRVFNEDIIGGDL